MNCYEDLAPPCLLHTQPMQFVTHTRAFQIPRYKALDCAHSSDHAVPIAAMNSVM
jgi:hypothetical protein